MKYIKKFKSIYEQLEVAQAEGITTSAFSPSQDPMGDYDITWQNESGEDVTASFKEITKQIEKEGDEGYTYFETLPGSSTDGGEYAAEAEMENNGDGSYQVIGFTIMPK
jgi:hypothetical protein